MKLNPRKVVRAALATLVLSVLLQSIADPSLFKPAQWDVDTWVNVLHFWLTFLTVYLLFDGLAIGLAKKYKPTAPKHIVGLLIVVILIVFLWIIVTDALFYTLYYDVSSLTDTTFYNFDLPLAAAILAIGGILYYPRIRTLATSDTHKRGEDSQDQLKIVAYAGKATRLIEIGEVANIYVADAIVWIETLSGKTLHSDSSLAKLAAELPKDAFFRINRQSIVSRAAIAGFEKGSYQKLEITLIGGLGENTNLVVSKYNAPAFKKWLTNSA